MLNHTVSVWAISQSKMIIYQSVKYKGSETRFPQRKVCHITYNEIKCIFVAFCNKLLLQNVCRVSSFFLKFLEDIGPFVGSLILPLFWSYGDVCSFLSKTGWMSPPPLCTCFIAYVQGIPLIHLWCNTCWPPSVQAILNPHTCTWTSISGLNSRMERAAASQGVTKQTICRMSYAGLAN